jgi:alpha-D-xyloside xylohydrolase
MANYALSTAFIPADSLTFHVYPGKDASFTLYEDDGVTEAYRVKNEKRTTSLHFNQSSFSFQIEAAVGTYTNAPEQRAYQIVFHDVLQPVCFEVNGVKIKTTQTSQNSSSGKTVAVWDANRQIISVTIPRSPVTKAFEIKRIKDCQ